MNWIKLDHLMLLLHILIFQLRQREKGFKEEEKYKKRRKISLFQFIRPTSLDLNSIKSSFLLKTKPRYSID